MERDIADHNHTQLRSTVCLVQQTKDDIPCASCHLQVQSACISLEESVSSFYTLCTPFSIQSSSLSLPVKEMQHKLLHGAMAHGQNDGLPSFGTPALFGHHILSACGRIVFYLQWWNDSHIFVETKLLLHACTSCLKIMSIVHLCWSICNWIKRNRAINFRSWSSNY